MLGCDIFIQVALSCSVGGKLPFEAIFVSCKDSSHSPTVVILHGGPHSVSVSSYVKSSAFLASLGFNLLIVNYRYVPWNFSAPLQLCMSSSHGYLKTKKRYTGLWRGGFTIASWKSRISGTHSQLNSEHLFFMNFFFLSPKSLTILSRTSKTVLQP